VALSTALKKTGVTAAELADWLNANAAFKARAIAWVEDCNGVSGCTDAGKLGIRSRNLGRVHSTALLAGDVNTAVFGGDTSVHIVGGSNQLYLPTSGIGDWKVTRTAANITYQLDLVDDLAPGTYVVTTEITDRGRKSSTDYKTPSIAKLPFNVKQSTEEKLVANNCNGCHESDDGKGYVLDYARHHKIFDNTATDQCGACHDYQSGKATGDWSGGYPISRRVHSVHVGSSLQYPIPTVGHTDGVPGRFWDITLPNNPRACDETCHTADSSGSWMTKASRSPCYGCHDSDAAQSHFKLMTFDPTPQNPWSGDEEESCQTCH
jgi:hypothetical protein